MEIPHLFEAAALADELSASRRKQIVISVHRDGLVIDGCYRDASLAVRQDFQLAIPWKMAIDGHNVLVLSVRQMDEKLTTAWREASASAE